MDGFTYCMTEVYADFLLRITMGYYIWSAIISSCFAARLLCYSLLHMGGLKVLTFIMFFYLLCILWFFLCFFLGRNVLLWLRSIFFAGSWGTSSCFSFSQVSSSSSSSSLEECFLLQKIDYSSLFRGRRHFFFLCGLGCKRG